MTNPLKGLMALGVAAALAGCMGAPAGTANAPLPASFNTWDSSDDGFLDEGEFGVNWANAGEFDRWNANRDGMVDRNEFDAGAFNTLDRSNDARLNEGEGIMG